MKHKEKIPTAEELGFPFKVGDSVWVPATITSIPAPGTHGWKLAMVNVHIVAPGGEHGLYGGGTACTSARLLKKA